MQSQSNLSQFALFAIAIFPDILQGLSAVEATERPYSGGDSAIGTGSSSTSGNSVPLVSLGASAACNVLLGLSGLVFETVERAEDFACTELPVRLYYHLVLLMTAYFLSSSQAELYLLPLPLDPCPKPPMNVIFVRLFPLSVPSTDCLITCLGFLFLHTNKLGNLFSNNSSAGLFPVVECGVER